MRVRLAGRRSARLLGAVAAAALVAAPLGLGHPAAASGGSGGTTVPAPAGGSVTVEQTVNLVHQVVTVSWQGFKPSFPTGKLTQATEYPVRIYQCRGTAPASPADCYGSSAYTFPGQTDTTEHTPDGPSNQVDAITAADGTGVAQVEIRTFLESSTLGCSSTSPCSLVVIPNYGNGDKADDFLYATTAYMDSSWAWANHATVPLSFAPSANTCPLTGPTLNVVGAPQTERAMLSWQPAACHAAAAVNMDWTGLEEPEARLEFEAGRADVGVTTLPMSGQPVTRPFAYAPLDITGITVSFHVDDAVTGLPITTMNLDARLVAKLLTESYPGIGYGYPQNPKGDAADAGNPACLYTDPEFLKLNPGHTWPLNFDYPLIDSGNTDLIEELTAWVWSDPTARAFLQGTPDPWGMHVNTYYKGVQWPEPEVEQRDPYPGMTYQFIPIDGLDNVADGLVLNQPAGVNPQPNQYGQHPKEPPQTQGERALIAFVDTSNATAFEFPSADLENAAGAFVGPTGTAMSAAVADMTTNADGVTRAPNFTAKDAAAYPLTTVQYAMVPTAGASKATIGEIQNFLGYASGPGQVSGLAPGELPPGYLPLTPAMVAEDAAAAHAVAVQAGTRPPPRHSPAPPPPSAGPPPAGSGSTPGATGAAGGTGGSGTTRPVGPGARTPAAPAAGSTAIPAVMVAHYRAAGALGPGTTGTLLPLLLGFGLLGALGGPALLATAHGQSPLAAARRLPAAAGRRFGKLRRSVLGALRRGAGR